MLKWRFERGKKNMGNPKRRFVYTTNTHDFRLKKI